MDLEKVKQYARIDYDDDDEIVQMMLDAAIEEMEELSPKFDKNNMTAKQKILVCAIVKEMYDKRDQMTEKKESVRYTIRSLLLKEMLR